MKNYVIIMAAGDGKRMNSNIPKPLIEIYSVPMIAHLLFSASYIEKNVLLVVSTKNKDVIIKTLIEQNYLKPFNNNNHDIFKFDNITVYIIIQEIANGTGGALLACSEWFEQVNKAPNAAGGALLACSNYFEKNNDKLDYGFIVLSADAPLISIQTINKMCHIINNTSYECVLLGKVSDNNYGYGRIVLNNNNDFIRIVEHKDCSEEELKIKLINSGIYCFKSNALFNSLEHIDTNNSQSELYLTDCPKYMKSKVIISDVHKYDETLGANTPEQLNILKDEYLKKFCIENILIDKGNLSYENINNLSRCLNQLSPGLIHIDCSYFRKLDVMNKIMLVVKFEHIIIGTGTLLIEHKIIHNMGKVGHIEDIVIDKRFRGLGLAKKLINELVTIAKKYKCYKIILNCTDELVGFYSKFGMVKHSNCMRLDI